MSSVADAQVHDPVPARWHDQRCLAGVFIEVFKESRLSRDRLDVFSDLQTIPVWFLDLV